MVSAMTGARIIAAHELQQTREVVRSVRSLICWTPQHVRQIDEISRQIDALINTAMGSGRCTYGGDQ
jgi:hypothetical protein